MIDGGGPLLSFIRRIGDGVQQAIEDHVAEEHGTQLASAINAAIAAHELRCHATSVLQPARCSACGGLQTTPSCPTREHWLARERRDQCGLKLT